MKGELPQIIGSRIPLPSNYQAFPSSVERVKQHIIHEDRGVIQNYQSTKDSKLQWMLRYNENVPEFIQSLDRWNKEVYNTTHESDKEVSVLQKILALHPQDITDEFIQSYKKKVIDSNLSYFQDVCDLLEVVYNSLKDKKYTHLKTYIKRVYGSLKDMILSYQGLK